MLRRGHLVGLLALGSCVVVPAGRGAEQGAAPLTPTPPGATTSDPLAAGPPAPAGALTITLRSGCPKSVRVRHGGRPAQGAGATTVVDPHSAQPHRVQPGEELWLVDETDQDVSSTTVDAATREVEVRPKCDGFIRR